MTIKADWMHIWKNENKHIFSKQCQHPSDVAFIDGQIKLMKATHVHTWKELIYRNYCGCVNKYFQMGINTVVLAFDDYDYVPLSKNMTQTKRKRHVPSVDFSSNQTLPPEIPGNWQQCIMNRTFKTKVIHLVVETVPQLIRLTGKQKLIVDFKGLPVMYTADQEPCLLENFMPLGEADIKFTRYAEFGNMLIDATDGDYVPIALLKLEKLKNQNLEIPNISIYRMEIRTTESKKRSVDGALKFSYEYLHVNSLYRHLLDKVFIKLGSNWRPNYRGTEMYLLAACITYTGCDFSKGLPFIGAKKIWDNLGIIWPALAEGFDPGDITFDVDIVREKVVSRLYTMAYKKHFTHNIKLSMKDAIEHLQKRSKLSESVKEKLPSVNNVNCLIKNAVWILAYWTCGREYPDPMGGEYGFKFNKKGIPMWEDCE